MHLPKNEPCHELQDTSPKLLGGYSEDDVAVLAEDGCATTVEWSLWGQFAHGRFQQGTEPHRPPVGQPALPDCRMHVLTIHSACRRNYSSCSLSLDSSTHKIDITIFCELFWYHTRLCFHFTDFILATMSWSGMILLPACFPFCISIGLKLTLLLLFDLQVSRKMLTAQRRR